MKKWLQLHSNNIVAVLTNEMWKRYWCCLKGYSLYFYTVVPSDDASAQTAGGSNRAYGVEEIRLRYTDAVHANYYDLITLSFYVQ